MDQYHYEMKFEEHIYIGETNEYFNNLEKYWILFSNVTGFMVIDKNGELISSKSEDFITISDFRDGKLKDLDI